jgi:hypothetical protein
MVLILCLQGTTRAGVTPLQGFLRRNQAFIGRYREARADHLAGREALFSAGTSWLRRFAGVKCAELDATAPPS